MFDYADDKWSSLGKYCGREIPRTLNSTSNKMKIFFKTDESTVAAGFQAKWTLNCGGSFPATTQPQYLVSPGYPADYQNSLHCVYNITASENIVNIDFEDFELENKNRLCIYDNVTIENYKTQEYRGKPRIFCGKSVPPPIRLQDGAVITFKTDKWVTNRGFKLRYQTDGNDNHK